MFTRSLIVGMLLGLVACKAVDPVEVHITGETPSCLELFAHGAAACKEELESARVRIDKAVSSGVGQALVDAEYGRAQAVSRICLALVGKGGK